MREYGIAHPIPSRTVLGGIFMHTLGERWVGSTRLAGVAILTQAVLLLAMMKQGLCETYAASLANPTCQAYPAPVRRREPADRRGIRLTSW